MKAPFSLLQKPVTVLWMFREVKKIIRRMTSIVLNSIVSTLLFSDSAFSDIYSCVSQVFSYKVIFAFSQPKGVEFA